MAQLRLNKIIVFPLELAFDTEGVQRADGFEVSEPKSFSATRIEAVHRLFEEARILYS